MRNEEHLLGRLNRAEFGTADERAVRELIEDLALAKGLLEIIQQSLVDQRWQTLGDLYRGKTLFLSQDLLNRIDTALDPKEHK